MTPAEETVLRKLWRRGLSEIHDQDLVQYCGERSIDLNAVVPHLCHEGLLTSYLRRYYDLPNATFLILTPKGKEHFYALETPKWQAMLRTSPRFEIEPRAQQAHDLHKVGTMKAAGNIMGVGVSQVSALCRRFERLDRLQKRQEEAIQSFLDGRTPFKELPVGVLGNIGVRLWNTLFDLEIETIPQLMELNCRRFLAQRNAGRSALKELMGLLLRFDTEMEPFGWRFAQPPL